MAFGNDLDGIIARAEEAGVGPILAVGSTLASSRRAVDLAHRYGAVYAAIGIHPHEAGRFEEERDGVRALLSEEKVVAVGEIGLDYVRDHAPKAVQMAAFRTQLEWAADSGLPASIHNRAADDDVLEALRETGARGVMHCFSSDWDTAAAALALQCCISFAGNLTFPKSAALRDVAGKVPLDRLLVESDAPVLAPQPTRGRRNEPAYTVMTSHTLAGLQHMPADELAATIGENARRVFGWSAA